MSKKVKVAFIIMIILILVIPLGLLTDEPAWGEWDNSYYQKVLGFIPKGIENALNLPHLLQDYSVAGVNDIVGYYISAVVGSLLIFGIIYILGKFFAKKHNNI